MTKPEVRIGLLGAGPWGRNLLRAFQKAPRARIAAICDTNPERASTLGLGASIRITTATEALIGAAGLDAIVIATPAETHALLASWALESGHHVFVEKPMALATKHAALLGKRASERALHLMVGHVLLYHPAVEVLLRLIREGELGDVVRVHARRFSASRHPRREGTWWSLAPHDVSLARQFFASDPHAITARRSGSGDSERVDATLSFTGGRIATIEVGLREASDVRLVFVVGTRQSALFDDRAPHAKLTLFDTPAPRDRDPFERSRARSRVVPIAGDEPLAVEATRFIDAIVDGHPIASDAGEGLAVTRVLEMGASSLAADGASVHVAAPETSSAFSEFSAFPSWPCPARAPGCL